jgi:epoxyqueuosine reductase QueG/putative sterol carrier protein
METPPPRNVKQPVRTIEDEGNDGTGRAGSQPRNAHTDWSFPFPAPGRPKKAKSETADPLPVRSKYRWPYRPIQPTEILPSRGVPSPVSAETFKREMIELTECDDVGIVSIDDPALAHERDEILYIYPHARSLVCMIAEQNKPSMQSRYLPTANHELYTVEERLFEIGRKTIKYIKTLGGEGLTTTIGWPQEVSVRWADKIWPLSHKLVAAAAGLGVIGLSRNFLHKKFGAYCLIDTVVTNLEFDETGSPFEWNPCVECNLCVASCPTEAIRSDGDFDFFACYNHTYRDSIPGFLDLVRDLAEAKPKRFDRRWSDPEIAALWQSLSFKVEYRCFNCISTCPAEIHTAFHEKKHVRRDYLDDILKPLSRTRAEEEERFVIDTPSAREKYGIPPGRWRTQPDPAGPASKVVRLVDLPRIRSQDVDAMMRSMPQYFRDREADGLDFTTQFSFAGDGGGDWVMEIRGNRCAVSPGRCNGADLTIRCDGRTFLGIHQGAVNVPLAMLTGRLRLEGRRRLFFAFPRLFAASPSESLAAKAAWRLKRAWRSRKGSDAG